MLQMALNTLSLHYTNQQQHLVNREKNNIQPHLSEFQPWSGLFAALGPGEGVEDQRLSLMTRALGVTSMVFSAPPALLGWVCRQTDAWFGYFYVRSNPHLPGLLVRFWLSSFF